MTTTPTTELAFERISPELKRRAERYLTRKPNRDQKVNGGRLHELTGPDKWLLDAYLQSIQPTGNENLELMVDCLAYAEQERVTARNAGRKSRFQMGTWVVGTIFKDEGGGPPPLTCGTSACLAGTAAAFTLRDDEYMTAGADIRRLSNPEQYAEQRDRVQSGRSIGYGVPSEFVTVVENRGQAELGLNRRQASVLFFLTDARLESVKLVASYVTGYDLTGVGL